MASFRTSPQLSARAIIVWAFACLFALQGLGLTAPPILLGNASSRANQSVIVSTNDGWCGALGGDTVPAQGRHDPSECLSCKASGRDAAFANIVASIDIATYWPPETIVSLVRFIVDASSKPPRHFGTKLGTPIPADFPPDAATRVRNKALLWPMMWTSCSSTSTRWASARRWSRR